MKKYRKAIYYILFLAPIMIFCITGCGDEETSSPSTGLTEEIGETAEEYNFDEFANNTEQDVTELESDKISEQDAREIVKQIDTVNKKLKQIEKECSRQEEISEDNLQEYLNVFEENLSLNKIEGVSYWNREEDSIRLSLEDGGVIIYQPALDGVKAAGTGNGMNISTYQPFLTEFSSSIADLTDNTDDAARKVEAEFPEYNFIVDGTASDNDYNDEEVTLASVLNLSKNNIVIWDGHGGYNEEDGCFISTAVKCTTENMKKYAASKFVDTVMEKDSRVSLVTYNGEASENCRLTRNKELLKKEINDVYAEGGTNIYDAMEDAENILENSTAKKKIIVLMTDGLPNAGYEENGSYEDALVNYAIDLKNKGYYIYTLGFFSSVEDEELSTAQEMLEEMASPGYHYEVDSADDLVFFFDDIA